MLAIPDVDPEELALLLEYERRERARAQLELATEAVPYHSTPEYAARVASLTAEEHPKALASIRDPSENVAVCCTRRASKSRTWIRHMAETAAMVQDARVVYVNETRKECTRIAWVGNGRDGLLTLNRKYGLLATPNQTELTLTFPSGGIIELIGADDLRANDRVGRGGALHLLVVDEAQKAPHLDHLIMESASAAMLDYRGRIAVLGTPSPNLESMFFRITRDDEEVDEPPLPGWSVHRYSALDNPMFGATVEERYKRTVLDYCAKHGLSLDDPAVQRERFGRWVKSDAGYTYGSVYQVPEHELCYAPARWLVEPTKHHKDGRLMGGVPDIAAALKDLPQGPDWRFTLFADLGYDPDCFAYVLWAWSWEWDATFEVASFQQQRLDDDDQFQILRALGDKVPLSLAGGDIGGAARSTGKGWSKRWNERFGFGLLEAEKHRKFEHIRLWNTDCRKGRIKLRKGGPYLQQLRRVVWLPHAGAAKLEEDPRIPNDVTDAGLYGHRHTYAHRGERKTPAPPVGTPEYYSKLETEMEQADLDELERPSESYYE